MSMEPLVTCGFCGGADSYEDDEGVERCSYCKHAYAVYSEPHAQRLIEELERSGSDEATAEHSEVSLTQKIEQLEASLALCERRAEEAESRNVFLLTELERILKEAK